MMRASRYDNVNAPSCIVLPSPLRPAATLHLSNPTGLWSEIPVRPRACALNSSKTSTPYQSLTTGDFELVIQPRRSVVLGMPRRPATITQADVARTIRAARQAGADTVEVRPDGTIIVHLSPHSAPTIAPEELAPDAEIVL